MGQTLSSSRSSTDYSIGQTKLIEAINFFLVRINSHVRLTEKGQCDGLANLWGICRSHTAPKIMELKQFKKMLAIWTDKEKSTPTLLKATEFQAIIRFIAIIQWLQGNFGRLDQLALPPLSTISQVPEEPSTLATQAITTRRGDIIHLVGGAAIITPMVQALESKTKIEYAMAGTFNLPQLQLVLQEVLQYPGRIVIIHGGQHATALYKDSALGLTEHYDPNLATSYLGDNEQFTIAHSVFVAHYGAAETQRDPQKMTAALAQDRIAIAINIFTPDGVLLQYRPVQEVLAKIQPSGTTEGVIGKYNGLLIAAQEDCLEAAHYFAALPETDFKVTSAHNGKTALEYALESRNPPLIATVMQGALAQDQTGQTARWLLEHQYQNGPVNTLAMVIKLNDPALLTQMLSYIDALATQANAQDLRAQLLHQARNSLSKEALSPEVQKLLATYATQHDLIPGSIGARTRAELTACIKHDDASGTARLLQNAVATGVIRYIYNPLKILLLEALEVKAYHCLTPIVQTILQLEKAFFRYTVGDALTQALKQCLSGNQSEIAKTIIEDIFQTDEGADWFQNTFSTEAPDLQQRLLQLYPALATTVQAPVEETVFPPQAAQVVQEPEESPSEKPKIPASAPITPERSAAEELDPRVPRRRSQSLRVTATSQLGSPRPEKVLTAPATPTETVPPPRIATPPLRSDPPDERVTKQARPKSQQLPSFPSWTQEQSPQITSPLKHVNNS